MNITLPSAGALLKESWSYFKGRAVTLLLISAVATFGPYIAGFIIGIIVGIVAVAINSEAFIPVAFVLGAVAGLFIFAWSYTALLWATVSPTPLSFIDAFSQSWRKILSAWWIILLCSLVAFGGFFLLVLPGFASIIWFLFPLYILFLEDTKGKAALLRAREYVRGLFWPVAGRIFLTGLVLLLAFIAVVIVAYVIPLIYFSASLAQNPGALDMLRQFGSDIGSFLVTPLALIISFLLYKHIKEARASETLAPSPKTATFITVSAWVGVFVVIMLSLLVFVGFTAMEAQKAEEAQNNSAILNTPSY